MLNKTVGMFLSTWGLFWFKNSCSIPLGLLIHASPTYFLFINTTYTNGFYVLLKLFFFLLNYPSFWWQFFLLIVHKPIAILNSFEVVMGSAIGIATNGTILSQIILYRNARATEEKKKK